MLRSAQELTDEQIAEVYGSMIETALRAFAKDGRYVEHMARNGRLIAGKQAVWRLRMEQRRDEIVTSSTQEAVQVEC